MTWPTGVVQTRPSPDSLPLRAASVIAATISSDAVVLDDEDQQRLRQEARLEDAPAVLVRDPALPAVADRLDHRHAHVPGRVLDRVDHRLDALADDDGLDLDHSITSLRRSIRTVSRQRPSRLAIRLRTPTTRKPTRWCSFRDASFSGKIDVFERPEPGALALRDERLHQRLADAFALCVARDVDARLGDAAIRPARRHGRRMPPSRSPARRSPRRPASGCASCHASHGGTSVSKVAMPPRIPSR